MNEDVGCYKLLSDPYISCMWTWYLRSGSLEALDLLKVGFKTMEKEMAAHSSSFVRKIPWTEEPVGYSAWGRKESDATERLHFQDNREVKEAKQGRGRS